MPSEAEAARASVPRRPLGDSLTAPAGAGTPRAGPRASGGRADTKALSLCHQQRQKHPSELAPPHGELDLTTTRPNPDQTSLRPSDYRHVGLHRILLRSKERPFPTPVSFTGPSARPPDGKASGGPSGEASFPHGKKAGPTAVFTVWGAQPTPPSPPHPLPHPPHQRPTIPGVQQATIGRGGRRRTAEQS